eukprot:1984374-Amphidinium_carterae.1
MDESGTFQSQLLSGQRLSELKLTLINKCAPIVKERVHGVGCNPQMPWCDQPMTFLGLTCRDAGARKAALVQRLEMWRLDTPLTLNPTSFDEWA